MLPSTAKFRLDAHPSARNQAVATSGISAATTIISIPSLTTVLLESERGRRCDGCFQNIAEQRQLRRCTGCGSVWYCDVECQNMSWRTHHKKLCRSYNSFTASNDFQSLPTHEKLDSLLLSQLLVQASSSPASVTDPSSPFVIYRSLLPGSSAGKTPPVFAPGSSAGSTDANELYSRFGNNNFAIHSHLNTVGHGVFPLASRLFNHSCVPNAVAKYTFITAKVVTMEIIALRDISPEEEICLPYLDPALFQSRQQIFELTYGFTCTCISCQSMESLGPIPSPPVNLDGLASVATQLRKFTKIDDLIKLGLLDKPRENIPRTLLCVFHETYLSSLSETFSKSSHEGQYDLALDAGVTLLALYVLIYPQNYPQIGMHLLELAKTTWNMTVSSLGMGTEEEKAMKERARIFLSIGHKILMVLGIEGDRGGPLQEAETLQSLLD